MWVFVGVVSECCWWVLVGIVDGGECWWVLVVGVGRGCAWLAAPALCAGPARWAFLCMHEQGMPQAAAR